MMLRKLVFGFVCLSVLGAPSSYGLDLGALRVYSSASEPLEAEIALLETENLAPGDIKIRFAGVDDMAISGLDTRHYLSDIKFFVVLEKHTPAVLRLVSEKPVSSSYLSFLLEVNWPDGRLLREYTALLRVTPQAEVKSGVEIREASFTSAEPGMTKQNNPAAISLLTEPVTRPEAVESENKPDRLSGSGIHQARPEAPAGSVADNRRLLSETIRVGSKETLWDIARKHPLAEKYSNQQMMFSIFEKNPQAFANNNINELKHGALIVLPGAEEIGRYNEQGALQAAQTGQPASEVVAASATDNTVIVGPQQTLWDIAAKYRTSPDVSMHQLMQAIVRQNPAAFKAGNINQLRKGAVLKIPEMPEIDSKLPPGLPDKTPSDVVALQSAPAAKAQSGVPDKPAVSVVRIGAQETLWSIATNNLPNTSVSARQMIRAIVEKNPHAFNHGNINEMQVGALLKMPTLEEIAQPDAR
ncbi:MAG: FimV/HubP family polar landmark protein [Pontibacterium sp.]